MTRFWLIILRIVCVIQMLIAIFQSLFSFTGLLLNGEFIFLLQAIAFALIAALPVFTFIIFNNNFPDKLIEGRLKRNFNRLFLINFLLISFLFGFVFMDYKQAIHLSEITGTYRPYIEFFIPFIVSCTMLIFHFSILYGLYWLRRHINNNNGQKQFDFEMQDENV